MKIISFFSGVAGFEIAAKEVFGNECEILAFCEKEEFPQQILKKHFPGTMIFEDINEWKTISESLLSRQDFPVKMPVSPIKMDKDCPEIAPVFTGNSIRPFAYLDHNTSSWKTFQTSLIEESSRFIFPWLRSVMMQSGRLYRLPNLGRFIAGKGSISVPTPTVRDGESFYIATLEGALRIKATRKGQLHWIHTVLMWENLPKGRANPRFSEWMMNIPIGWTQLTS